MAGGPVDWYTDDRQSVFGEPANYSYRLEIIRRPNSAPETYGEWGLQVKPAQIVANNPTIVSLMSATQGQAYRLDVKTATPAGRVTSQWHDMTEGGMASDASKTNWQMTRTVFDSKPMPVTVRVYDMNNNLTGQVTATINVLAPQTSVRVVDVSKNILVNEPVSFVVETSLNVAQLRIKLGNAAPVAGVPSNYGQVKQFRVQLHASQAGQVPYLVEALSDGGQLLQTVNGAVAVADSGDSLKVPNPVPVNGVAKGTKVSWAFITNKSCMEMWLEVNAPIGNIPLTGCYLNHVFNYPPGKYQYKLMRRDHLGNVFPIAARLGTAAQAGMDQTAVLAVVGIVAAAGADIVEQVDY